MCKCRNKCLQTRRGHPLIMWFSASQPAAGRPARQSVSQSLIMGYALKPKASIRPYLFKTLSKRALWTSVHVDLYTVLDQGSTALAITYIGYGVKVKG